MILGALEDAGGRDYLKLQAFENPTAFMTLLSKVLPMQVSGENGGALLVDFKWQDAPTPTITDDTATDQSTLIEEGEFVWADHTC